MFFCKSVFVEHSSPSVYLISLHILNVFIIYSPSGSLSLLALLFLSSISYCLPLRTVSPSSEEVVDCRDAVGCVGCSLPLPGPQGSGWSWTHFGWYNILPLFSCLESRSSFSSPHLICGAALWSLISAGNSALTHCQAQAGVLCLHQYQENDLHTPGLEPKQLSFLLRYCIPFLFPIHGGFLFIPLNKATCYNF